MTKTLRFLVEEVRGRTQSGHAYLVLGTLRGKYKLYLVVPPLTRAGSDALRKLKIRIPKRLGFEVETGKGTIGNRNVLGKSAQFRVELRQVLFVHKVHKSWVLV